MEIAKNIFDKFTRKPAARKHTNCYEIYITWDMNDGDNMSDFCHISEEEFKKDSLFQYVLSYITGGTRFYRPYKSYGKHVAEDIHFNWLEDYLIDNGLMLFSDWGPCHSVVNIEMSYYNENGIKEDVIIPRFDTLFEGKSEKEMEGFMNKLYEGD